MARQLGSAGGGPPHDNRIAWLDDTLWSRVSEVVGFLHGVDLRQTSRVMEPRNVDPLAPSSGPGASSVVCSPDVAVYTSPAAERVFHCTLCRKTFTQKNTYQNHMRSHNVYAQGSAVPPSSSSGVASPPAAQCPAPSSPGSEVSTTAVPGAEDPYPCTICGKTFAVPARLTRHFRTHTGEKPYTCEFCSKSFSVKENLSVHRRIHTKERPYKCDVCARAFEHSGKLHRHMRIHTGERPHRCNVCGKTFIQSGQLVIHTRTHTGEKPYVCTVCRKGFTCSKQLKVHSRTHTGEKPYACEICGKAFGYNHVLKLHQVAHYGEKVYKCTLCNTTFTNKKGMEAHIKTHSGSGPQVESQAGVSAQQPREAGKENKEAELRSRGYYNYQSPPTLTIDPALLAAVAQATAAADDEEQDRSSSATPPLRVDEDAPPEVTEPVVRLLPDPFTSLARGSYALQHQQRNTPSPEYLGPCSPTAPSAHYVDPRRSSLPTPPTTSDSPSPSSSPDIVEQQHQQMQLQQQQQMSTMPRKKTRIILQRYMEEMVPTRASTVIRYAQRQD